MGTGLEPTAAFDDSFYQPARRGLSISGLVSHLDARCRSHQQLPLYANGINPQVLQWVDV